MMIKNLFLMIFLKKKKKMKMLSSFLCIENDHTYAMTVTQQQHFKTIFTLV